MYGKHLIRGYLTLDAATSGVGKSINIIADALALVTGRNLVGDEPVGKFRVWLWNGEDPHSEIERRIAAACKFYNITEADIGGRLFVDSGRDTPLVIVTEDKGGAKIATPIIEAVKQTILTNDIDIFMVDPLITTHSVSENDNTKIAVVSGQWAQIGYDMRCAVQLVHHIRKNEGRETTVEDLRGAGSLVSTSRAVRLLTPMSVEQADAAGIKPVDRYRYFCVKNGKSNLSAHDDHSEWRQIVSQPMGNGQQGKHFTVKPQDYVGVVTEWHRPSAASLIDDVSAEDFEVIKARIGGCRENPQANDWAGHVIALQLGLEMDDKAQKAKVAQMLRAWIAAGHFEIVEEKDQISRKVKKIIVVRGAAPPRFQ